MYFSAQKLLELEEVSESCGDHPYDVYHHRSNSESEIPLVFEMESNNENTASDHETVSLDIQEASQILVNVNHLAASWSQDKAKLVLQDISFEVNSTAPLLAVVGPVGAGKVMTLVCC